MARLTLSDQLAESQTTIRSQQATIAQLRQDIMSVKRVMEGMNASHALEIGKIRQEADKQVSDAKGMQKYYNDQYLTSSNELEQAHAVLDGVEGAPPREYDAEYGKGKRNVVTRLAGAFLAIAKNGGAK